MATVFQDLGNLGEKYVTRHVKCPRCKQIGKTLRMLPTNFKCADLICDFCGYLAQVKTRSVLDESKCPVSIPGAAWGPQSERMKSGIYFPLFIVTVNKRNRRKAIFYLPADFQTEEMFTPRRRLKRTAKRAGWQGYNINLNKAISQPVRVIQL